MAKAKAKSFIELFKKLGKLNSVPQLERLPQNLQRLIENWDSLPQYVQDAILILGRVRRNSGDESKASIWLQKRGETPEWLLSALTILKDSGRYLTDTEIAKRVGVNPSTLCRNESYKNAKRAYLQPYLTIGRRGLRRNPGPKM